MPNKENLFQEFQDVTTQAWIDKITVDLKGADYNKKMLSQTLDGIQIKPFYRDEDIQNLDFLKQNAGAAPFLRGIAPNENHWDVKEVINAQDLNQVKDLLTEAISRGVNAIEFQSSVVDQKLTGTPIESLENFKTLFDDLREHPKFNFNAGLLTPHLSKTFLNYAKSRNANTQNLEVDFENDPIGEYFRGHHDKLEILFSELKEIILEFSKELPKAKNIQINGSLFHDAGAPVGLELGLTLALLSETLAFLKGLGLEDSLIVQNLKIKTSVGSQYFQEISKIRALRHLTNLVLTTYNKDLKNSYIPIEIETSRWNQTLFDPHVNMLRATTEVMSAAIGGADSIAVLSFNTPFEEPTLFSQRIARNTQYVLKNESYLDKVADPAGGSYYLESLTDEIANVAWKHFQEIEKEGGLVLYFKKGNLIETLSQFRTKRNELLNSRREILLGSNQFANPLEEKLKNIKKRKPIKLNGDALQATSKYKSAFDENVIQTYRGAIKFEKLRLKTETAIQEGLKANIVLFPYGHRAMRTARSNFAFNFFGGLGLKITQNDGFEDIETGIQKVLEQDPRILIFCSSDEDYDNRIKNVITIIKDKKPNTLFIVAGNPIDKSEELQSFGVSRFIHIKSNVFETLTDIQKELGI